MKMAVNVTKKERRKKKPGGGWRERGGWQWGRSGTYGFDGVALCAPLLEKLCSFCYVTHVETAIKNVEGTNRK